MASYVLMQPPAGADAADGGLPHFVRDGFSWVALIAAPLWLAWRRLWLEAFAVLAAMILIGALGIHFRLDGMASLTSFLVSLWVALEAGALRLAGLRRRGFRELGVVEAATLADAEVRYAALLAEGDRPQPIRPAIRVPLARPEQADPGIRLIFPERR